MSLLQRKRKFNYRTKYATSFSNGLERAWAKLLAVLFDYGYIYIIRSTRKGKNPRLSRYKIGISYDLKQREHQVDRSIDGSTERVVFAVRVFFSERYEARLHRKFKKNNFVFEGSGKTEWFKLSPSKATSAMGWMKLYKAKQQAIILGAALAAFFLLHMLNKYGLT